MVEGRDTPGHASSAVRGKFLHPERGGTGPPSRDYAGSRLVTKGRSDSDRCGRELDSGAINGSVESRRGGGG